MELYQISMTVTFINMQISLNASVQYGIIILIF